MTKVGHIYLIDDDESMRTSLSRMLKDVGYIVEDFSSAVTFLEHSVPVAPAVILLDMQMPDMTGIDLQEKLFQLGRKTPIIFISGQSHPHQIVKSLKRGAVDFLFKPFNLEDLLKAVADALDLLNKDIAVKLGTTDATIKVHKARVMDKMHVESVQVLVAKYLESDLENLFNN
ncbi:response regulator transcription factor [Polynucleobacter necessarius]|uniref:response regulator transcription factor n=1 Tax=Polynucleobacter necessarius TaxID=576610 RepID=UPI000E09BB89|nr:response regulator [Polynucleobacter necessarius]